jgi:glycosyltransferase involved in cell wall biosynthesis
VAIAELPGAKIERGGRFRIGVFGEPRPEKGSTRLLGIVATLAELAGIGSVSSVDFVIQGSPADFQEGGVYGALQKFQEGKGSVLVSPQHNRISPEEFERLFHSVDAVLLPYEKSAYSLQGSGVIQDAVAAHKPVIHTEGISMMAFLSHGNGVSATTDREFAEAILRLATHSLNLQQGTARAAAYFQDALASNPLLRVVEAPAHERQQGS